LLEAFKVILVSAMPISELRGGIPLALYFGYSPLESYVLAFIGNLIPIPFLLIFLDKIEELMRRIYAFGRIYDRIVNRVEKKKNVVEKYGYFGLTLFVAIPLPITGAWTAALLAFLLRMNIAKAVMYIAIGIAIAGIIVTLASLGVVNIAYLNMSNSTILSLISIGSFLMPTTSSSLSLML